MAFFRWLASIVPFRKDLAIEGRSLLEELRGLNETSLRLQNEQERSRLSREAAYVCRVTEYASVDGERILQSCLKEARHTAGRSWYNSAYVDIHAQPYFRAYPFSDGSLLLNNRDGLLARQVAIPSATYAAQKLKSMGFKNVSIDPPRHRLSCYQRYSETHYTDFYLRLSFSWW